MLTTSLKQLFALALVVSVLTAGCTGGVSSPQEDATATFGSTPGSGGEAPALMVAGPLALPAAEYWVQGESKDTLATVRVGGCDAASTCPAFAIVSGVNAAGNGSNEAYLDDGIGCPGGDGLEVVSGTLTSTEPAVVAGAGATLWAFGITCVDSAGTELARTQKQWSVESPNGPVVIVDRWAFEGLGARLAGGQWLDADL